MTAPAAPPVTHRRPETGRVPCAPVRARCAAAPKAAPKAAPNAGRPLRGPVFPALDSTEVDGR
ncbi:hypothetical protein [Streptomyces sp. NPDC059072]|uniref:hypothetical protein n=1 Tax=unclassified Streptomyces TaxID=2593676 RepID=UPI003678BFD1